MTSPAGSSGSTACGPTCSPTSGERYRPLLLEEQTALLLEGGVAQLAHRPRFDLADALAGEAERDADFLERAGLAAVETEAETQHGALAFVERLEHALDLVTHQ